MRHSRARERREKCLRQNPAHRQQKNRKDKFHPLCGNGERLGFRDEASRCCARNAADNFPAALRIARAAILFFDVRFVQPNRPQITQNAVDLEKRNLRFLGSTGRWPVIRQLAEMPTSYLQSRRVHLRQAAETEQAGGLCSPETSALRAAHVGAGAGVDFDRFAFLDEKRHVNGLAGFELCRLGDVTGSVAAQTFR